MTTPRKTALSCIHSQLFSCWSYRLVKIGFVGNLEGSSSSHLNSEALPISQNRICWKLDISTVLNTRRDDAYRLVKIGFVGNNPRAGTIICSKTAFILPISQNRICWKLEAPWYLGIFYNLPISQNRICWKLIRSYLRFTHQKLTD